MIMHGYPFVDLDTRALSVTERAYIAVQAIRGWLTRPDAVGPGDGESEPVIWHRAFGDTRILVGVGE